MKANGGEKMKCERCGGMLLFEKFYGVDGEYYGYECIFCGEITDSLIRRNRIKQKGKKVK